MSSSERADFLFVFPQTVEYSIIAPGATKPDTTRRRWRELSPSPPITLPETATHPPRKTYNHLEMDYRDRGVCVRKDGF